MCLQELRQDDRGFSLIEVVLAVAILALVTLPIINYFTYSGLRTADGRDKQSATVVAEDVLDELNSYDDFTQIENIASSGAVGADKWTVVPDPSNPVKFTYTDLTKKVKMNNVNYEAKVHITYTDHTTAEGKSYHTGYDSNTVTKDTNSAIDSEFNDYKIPSPDHIYGKENVVAKEEDQIDQAVSYFLTNENTESTSFFTKYNLIKDKLLRKIAIDIREKDGDPDSYSIKVSYLYELNGANVSPNIKNGVYEVPLEISEVKKETLKNIYVFYNLRDDYDNDSLRLTFGSEITENDIAKIKFYMCGLTNSECTDRKMNYKFALAAGSDPLAHKCSFLFNGETETVLTAKKEDGPDVEFVPKENRKRIGAIEVSVYEEGGGDPLAVLNTTISE